MHLEHPDTPTQADAEAGREERRAERQAATMRLLERAREGAAEMIGRLNDGSACRLPPDQQERYDALRDPYLALDRAVRALTRIVMIEERLDEDADTRARRLAEAAEARAKRAEEEQAARDKAVRQEEAARAEEAADAAFAAKKRAIRTAVANIHRETFPEVAERELELLLDETLDDYLYEFDDDAIEAYADAEAVIVARLCETIGIMAAPDDTADDEPKPGKAARDRLVALVEEELAEIAAETAANGNRPEAEIRGPVSAQGPPG